MALLQIGITGGIGSGKSLVCRIFQVLGVPVYDADSRAKIVMTTDGILMENIRKEFGSLSYHPDGTLNRKWLGEQVFKNPEQLAKLNQLVHPRVRIDYENWVANQTFASYVLREAALLFESGSHRQLDKVIVVAAPEALRIQRVLLRDTHRTEDLVRDIIKNQMPEAEKLAQSDYKIINDESQLLIPQVLDLHKRFLSREL